jgi:hypothetical protein
MQRITTVLKASEAMAVRKAVCMAGAECVVIIPMPFCPCATDPKNWRFEQPDARSETHVRLEVTANDLHHGGIISAIRRIVHTGRVDLVSHQDSPHKHVACLEV